MINIASKAVLGLVSSYLLAQPHFKLEFQCFLPLVLLFFLPPKTLGFLQPPIVYFSLVFLVHMLKGGLLLHLIDIFCTLVFTLLPGIFRHFEVYASGKVEVQYYRYAHASHHISMLFVLQFFMQLRHNITHYHSLCWGVRNIGC